MQPNAVSRRMASAVAKALSHEHEGIRAVYIIAEYAEQRKEMFQWWANYINGLMMKAKLS